MSENPAVSIILATYNASHVLRYAILSILNLDFIDWELIVVGDHCTDDTEEVVLQFADERIRFYNLPENSGHQAKPSNTGLSMARGDYIAFLNQDDMFLPYHLDYLLAEIKSSAADIILSRSAFIYPFEVSGEWKNIRVCNAGHSPYDLAFSPIHFYVASAWLIRKSILGRVGPWIMENQTYFSPSQEWLFRAWRKNCKIHCTKNITVILVNTGTRKDFYKIKKSGESAFLYNHVIRTPTYRKELFDMIDHQEYQKISGSLPFKKRIIHAFKNNIRRLLMLFSRISGIHPMVPYAVLRYGFKKGSYIRQHNRVTGKIPE